MTSTLVERELTWTGEDPEVAELLSSSQQVLAVALYERGQEKIEFEVDRPGLAAYARVPGQYFGLARQSPVWPGDVVVVILFHENDPRP